MKFIQNLSLSFLMFNLGLLVFLPQTFSQNVLSLSSAEDVALAFYKTAGVRPDFKEWAKKTDEFKVTSLTETQNYIEKENQRLIGKWIDFDKTDSIININFSAKTKIKFIPTEKPEDPPVYNLEIIMPNAQKTYFPYTHQNTNFAVIAQDFKKLLNHKIEETQSLLILQNLKQNTEEPVDVSISIKPLKSYLDKPEFIDGMDQWALIGQVTTMKIVSKETSVTLLYYGAPWYISPTGKELIDIYDKRQSSVEKSVESGL